MTRIKDNVKKEPYKQGDMFYNELTKCYYLLTCIGGSREVTQPKLAYNLFNINKANLYYYESLDIEELNRILTENVSFHYVKEGEIQINGRL